MNRIFYGWWVVAGGGVVQFYASAVFWRGFAVFFDVIVDTFGWSRGAVGAAVSIQRLEGGMISPFIGTLINRYGTRKVMSVGVAITGLSFILMSQVHALWQFYLVIILLTIGMSFGTFIVLVVTVSNWFVRRRARALGILMAASGIGGLTVPLLSGMVDSFGWREVLFGIGIGFWLVGFPATLLMRQFPEDYGMRPDGDLPEGEEPTSAAQDKDAASQRRERHQSRLRSLPKITTRQALKMRFFWQLALVSSFGQFASASNIVHIDALTQNGITATVAAFAVGSVAIGDLSGRLLVAAFGDRINKRMALAGALGLEGIGILSIGLVNTDVFGFSIGMMSLPLYSIGFGLGFGSSVPIRLALLADYFGRESYGNVLGLTSSINAIFGATGALFAGIMFDLTDTYRIAFSVMALLLLISVPITATLESQERFAARNRYAKSHPK
jgi:sugar phosphate permease